MFNQYRYSIVIKYNYKGDDIEFDYTNIHSQLIDYNYDSNNMPIIYITASIDKNILDDMILNSEIKTLTIQVYKFINNSDFKLKELYIEGQFSYILPDNELNYNQSLDYSKETENSKDIFKRITIGLLKEKLIENNKIINNDVVKSASLNNTILNYMSHMPLLIEPVKDIQLNYSIIPPIESITELISFLDDNFGLYDNKYRLFYDFDKTYLLSSHGKSILSSGDEIDTIIIKVENTITEESKVQGMDIENNSCIIHVDTNDIDYYDNKVINKSFTGTMAINSDGNYNISGNKDRLRIIRNYNDNLDKGSIEQSEIDNTSFSISILKTDLDSSILTINKSYIIRNYDKLDNKDGYFLLSKKKEVYTPDDGNFILSTILTFRKIIS